MIDWLEDKKEISLIITILLIVEIFRFSSISSVAGVQTGAGSLIPTIYHFVVFFLLAFFLLASIKGNKELKPSYIIIALIISIIQAILDETHQIFVPFRYPSFGDILTDTLGIFFGILIYIYINRKIKRKDENHHSLYGE